MEKKFLDELEIAEEFLKVSKNNLNSSLKTSANRLYFAFERAVSAFFIYQNIKIPKNHRKLWEISAEFLGEDYYKIFRELYDLRLQADYGEVSFFIKLDKKSVAENINKVEKLIGDIKKRIL